MQKSLYKRIEEGKVTGGKCDLDVRYYLSIKPERKRWMKKQTVRWERRCGKRDCTEY